VLLRGRVPDPSTFAIAALEALVLLVVAWVVFHRAEYDFAENV